MRETESKHLFVFGFEDPIEFETNKTSGSDFESSRAVWIISRDATAAEDWGRSIAEKYVRELFARDGSEGYSWRDCNFAHWIEDHPRAEWPPDYLDSIPVVRLGDFPTFELLDDPNQKKKQDSEQGGAGQPATRSESK